MISCDDQILLLNSSQNRSLNLTKQKLKSDPYYLQKANSRKRFMTYRHFDSFPGEAFSSFLINCQLFVCGFLSLSVLNTGLLIKYHESISFMYTGTVFEDFLQKFNAFEAILDIVLQILHLKTNTLTSNSFHNLFLGLFYRIFLTNILQIT